MPSSLRHKLQKINASSKYIDDASGRHYVLLSGSTNQSKLNIYADEFSALADQYDFDEDIEFDPHPHNPWLLIHCTADAYANMLNKVNVLLRTVLEDESDTATKKRKVRNPLHDTKKFKPEAMPSSQPSFAYTAPAQFNPLIENKTLLPYTPPPIIPAGYNSREYFEWYDYEVKIGNFAPNSEDWYRSTHYFNFYNNSPDRSQLPPPKLGLPPTYYAHPSLPGYFGMPMPMPLPILTDTSANNSSSFYSAPVNATPSSSSSSSSFYSAPANTTSSSSSSSSSFYSAPANTTSSSSSSSSSFYSAPAYTTPSSSSSSSSSSINTTASSSSSSSSSNSTSAIPQSSANAFLRVGGFFAPTNQSTTNSPTSVAISDNENVANILCLMSTLS